MDLENIMLGEITQRKTNTIKVKVTQCCPTLCDTMDYTVHGAGSCSLLQGIFSTQGSNPGLCTVDSLPAEPQGKSKNTGVGSLSFLQ